MEINIFQTPAELGKAAGSAAAQIIREAIAVNGSSNIILATGARQFETINQLVSEKNFDRSKVNIFHLDEYIGLHPDCVFYFDKHSAALLSNTTNA